MKSFRIPSPRVLAVAATLAAVLSVDLVAAPTPAGAQTAARVESRTRPNFGLLLEPPTRPNRRRPRYDYDGYRPGWGRPDWGRPDRPGWGWRPGDQRDEIVVDCGGPHGEALEYAVRALRPGGALTLRGQGGACSGWLYIDKPITIQGEGGFDPRTGARVPSAVLQAPDGRPCIAAAPGVQVTIQDLTLLSPRAGSAACLVGEGADFVIRRVAIRHEGMEPAIDLRDGLLDLRDAQVEARTSGPAIVAENATINTQNLVISGAVAGIELEQGGRAPSNIHSTTLTGVGAPNSFGPRAIGIAVRARQDSARTEINGSRICGFSEGIAVEGVAVAVRGARICRADKGLVLYNGELALHDSRVRAREVGVAAVAGRAVVVGNVFAGVRQVFWDEDRASLEARDNRVWTRADICRPTFRPRHRDRHIPVWNTDDRRGYTCQYTPYPQGWWAEEEGALGQGYADDGYALDGWAWFQSGYGWYDRDGRYVSDQRFWGDDRWTDRPRRRQPDNRQPDNRRPPARW